MVQRPSGVPAPGRPRPVLGLLAALSRALPGASPHIQKAFTLAWYTLISVWARTGDAGFMNYGYASLEENIPTEPETDDASSLRLYAAVVDRANVFGKDVLEVGCGRGAGSHFILCALQARSVTGVDLAGRAIARCRAEYRQTGLTFRQADAERLPFANASFDVVVNVESSHAYPSMAKFLDQVGRVLRPGGFLLFADLRAAPELAALRTELRASDLGVVEEEDITANVVRSLERRSPSTLERLQAVPGPFRAAAIEFSAVVGTPTYELLKSGQTRYIRLILRKTPALEQRHHRWKCITRI